jgi:hypothetical protein
MSAQPKQEWRIEIGRTGATCQVFCNGVALTNVQSADLHLETGQPSILHLRLASGWTLPPEGDKTPLFHHGDDLSASGEPRVYVEINGRKFRIMEMMREGALDDSLFRERRTTTEGL